VAVGVSYAPRPRAGMSDSWNDDMVAWGALSQFQPPSGHCQSISRSTTARVRSFSSPSRTEYQIALPSIEAQWRTRSSWPG